MSGATTVEARNTGLVHQWAEAWNTDPLRMVDECYAPDCEVVDAVRGMTLHGRDQLREVEHRMIEIDPTRRMAIRKLVAHGDTVAVEIDATWRNETITIMACVVLTFGSDGLIVSDHTYSGDPLGVTAG